MTEGYTMRRFEPSPAEYEAIVRVYDRANLHDSGSVVTWQHWDQHRDPVRMFTRYVLEKDGELGGYGFSVLTDPAANIFRFVIYLLPNWESAGLISEFYSYIMGKCLVHSPAGLICQTREDDAEKIAWLRQQGFHEAMRYPRSTLMLNKFDQTVFNEPRAKIAEQGLEIISLVELGVLDLEWQHKVYELEMLLNEDVPRPSGFTPQPFDKYVQTEFEGPEFMPELWLIALDGDALVGMTSLWTLGDGMDMLETGLTGVHRDYRRQGLALALKSQAIEVVQQLGARIILTSNEENNPMYRLNLKLGFEAQPADIDWKKTLRDSRSGEGDLG